MVERRKKILHIYNVMDKGGAETFIFNVYDNIDRKKFQFDFLCQSKKPGFFDRDLKLLGSKVYHFKNFRSKHFFGVIRETVNMIKAHGPYDAIYLPTQFYSSVYCIAAKIAGIKTIVVHSHSAGEEKPNGIFRVIYQKVSRMIINTLATDRIACGEKAGRYLFGNRKSFKIIHNGIDFKKFYPATTEERRALRSKHGLGDNCLVVGNVGRFVKLKNHDFFIDLALELKKQRINHKIILVGDGQLFNHFKAKIAEKGLNASFELVGAVDDPSVYYRLFDVFVLPSFYEGFPTVVVEALACATPCLLSDSITKEAAIISKIVRFEKLANSAKKWVKGILRLNRLSISKESVAFTLKEKGYDIMDVANEMSGLYG